MGINMKKKIKKMCDLTVYNYRKLTDEFRFDGEYINHFAAIICSNCKMKLPNEKIKMVRRYFKDNTSRVSCFRGDILYILSFLIVKEKNLENFADEVIKTYEEMVDAGFKESQYLVLASYTFVKYGKAKDRGLDIYRMKEIYMDMKNKYNNVTNEEDYLECAMLSLSIDNKDKIQKYMDNTINSIMSLDMLSKNGAQGLTIALLLNKNKNAIEKINQLLLEFEKKNIRISNQFLPFIGSSSEIDKPEKYCDELEEVIQYLCNEEYEYAFYMDKSFRVFIALSIIELSKSRRKQRYLEELLAFGIYSFIVSKNQGILEVVLA